MLSPAELIQTSTKGASRITRVGDFMDGTASPKVKWQLVAVASKEKALLLEFKGSAPIMFRVMVGDTFPTAGGGLGLVHEILPEKFTVKMGEESRSIEFWRLCSYSSGRLQDQKDMEKLQDEVSSRLLTLEKSELIRVCEKLKCSTPTEGFDAKNRRFP